MGFGERNKDWMRRKKKVWFFLFI